MREKAAKSIYREVVGYREVLDVAEDKVSIDTDFGTDLNADSIDGRILCVWKTVWPRNP